MIELLGHNKETYKRLCDVLTDNNKCALVQATGTGKSYIAGKYIEEHTETALILVPTNAIADSWEDLLAGTEKEISIITYQAFAKEPQNYLDYDVVIADEMHHLGSDVWGKKFVETYLQSENHKIIGLTATEIRYLDNSRDMAEEIFENIRVDGCDLPTAINTGVLPTFKYVSALYCDESDFDEWKEKAGKIKDIKIQAELKGRLDVCIKNMVSVKQAVNENLTDDYRKIIVFLNNVESKETALEMFRDVFPTANFYDVDYSKQRTANNEQINQFKADKNRAVLFAVDMLNEGIHIKGTDCVIMFRKTVSPQIYLQQLGRALASGADKTPVVFDFVANIKNISHKFSSDTEKDFMETLNDSIQKDNKILILNYSIEIQDVIKTILEKTNYKFWSEKEDVFLKENYKIMSVNEICKELKREKQSVITRAKILGVSSKQIRIEWTKEKDDFIKEKYGIMSNQEIADFLGISKCAVRSRAEKLGVTKSGSPKWEDEEKNFIIENYGVLSASEMSEKIGRSVSSIISMASKLGVARKYDIRKEDVEFIKRNYKKMPTIKISEKLGVTEGTVRRIAKKNGLMKRQEIPEEQIEFVKKNYKYMTEKQMAEELGVSKGRIVVIKKKFSLNRFESNEWSKAEDDFIIENVGKISIFQISKKLKRGNKSVKSRAIKLGIISDNIKNRRRKFWGNQEDSFIKENVGKMETEEIAKYLKRSKSSVKNRITYLQKRNGRAVVQLDKELNFVNKFDNVRQANESVGIKGASTIYSCINGQIEFAGGCKWLYEEDYKKMIEGQKKKTLKS